MIDMLHSKEAHSQQRDLHICVTLFVNEETH